MTRAEMLAEFDRVWSQERRDLVRIRRGVGDSHAVLTDMANKLAGPQVSMTDMRRFIDREGIKLDPVAIKRTQSNVGNLSKSEREAAKRSSQKSGMARMFAYERPTPVRIVIPKEPVILPAPNPETGKIEVPLGPLMAWTQQNGIENFHGGNVEALNDVLARRKIPPVVVIWP